MGIRRVAPVRPLHTATLTDQIRQPATALTASRSARRQLGGARRGWRAAGRTAAPPLRLGADVTCFVVLFCLRGSSLRYADLVRSPWGGRRTSAVARCGSVVASLIRREVLVRDAGAINAILFAHSRAPAGDARAAAAGGESGRLGQRPVLKPSAFGYRPRGARALAARRIRGFDDIVAVRFSWPRARRTCRGRRVRQRRGSRPSFGSRRWGWRVTFPTWSASTQLAAGPRRRRCA